VATNVSVDSILDAMVTQLSTEMVPTTGDPITTLKPIRTCARYLGKEFEMGEGQKRGIAGRCPAVRVQWAGTRTIRTTIGRRTDRVESTFKVIVASDNQHGRDLRTPLLALAETVRSLVGSRAFGLPMAPTRYRQTETKIDEDAMLALELSFTALHRVDYSIDPGSDTMIGEEGTIINAAVAQTSLPHAPTVTPQGTAGTTTWSYAIVGIDADGLRTLISPTGTTATGAATLNGTNFNTVTWDAYDGIATYEISRRAAGGTPATTGVIGSTALLTFNDTGLAVTGNTPPDSLHVDLDEVFP
jgi:hypothetical protein